jgi:hypothetical protein
VGSGHSVDQVSGLRHRDTRGGKEQRAGQASVQYWHRVLGGTEGRLGHSDDQDLELVVDVGSQPVAAPRIEMDVAVDDEAQRSGVSEYRAQWWQLPLEGAVRRNERLPRSGQRPTPRRDIPRDPPSWPVKRMHRMISGPIAVRAITG